LNRGTFRLFIFFACGGFLLPAVSRSEIAYSAFVASRWRIFVQANLEGSAREVVHYFGADATAPALSFDGKNIAFEVQGKGIARCAAVSPFDCRIIPGTNADSVQPAWSPADEVAYVQFEKSARGEDSALMLVSARGSSPKVLLQQTGIQAFPRFARDGKYLLYVVTAIVTPAAGDLAIMQSIWKMNLVNGKIAEVTTCRGNDINPAANPTGDRIAFASQRSGQFELWESTSTGEGVRQITSGPGAKSWPAWSPDGEKLLFAQVRDGFQKIALVPARGGAPEDFQPRGFSASTELRDPDWR